MDPPRVRRKARFVVGGPVGFIDRTGKLVTSFGYDEAVKQGRVRA